MIRDGHTGWLAEQATNESLTQTLRRALETPPDMMAEMGRQASDEIEQICSPKLVLEKQIEFRNRIVQQPAARSLSLPIPASRPQMHRRKDGVMPELLVERTGWPSRSPVNQRKRRTQKSGLKLITIFNLARARPAFFFEMALWVFRQVKKRASRIRVALVNSQRDRWLGWGYRSGWVERRTKERSSHD